MVFRRKKRKLIKLIGITLFLILLNTYLVNWYYWNFNYEYVKINFKKIAYELDDFLINNFKSRDEIILPESIELVETNEKNHKCLMPMLNHNEKLSIDFLKSDYASLESTFESCQTKNAQINIDLVLNVEIFKNETYLFKLNYTLIKLSFDFVTEPNDLKCLIQKFDKKINESEEFEDIEYFGNKIKFDSNLEIFLNNSNSFGYYYFYCTYNSRFLFDYVYNLMPFNMNKLIEKRKIYKRSVEKFLSVNNINVNENQYFSNDFLNCKQEKILPQKKMNVLILGIDSISFNHFRRIFPLTYEYLKETSLIYDHFSSLGSNTYPNILAMMTGIIEDSISEFNISSEIDYYRKLDDSFHDHLPFVWNEYENMGYITHYQEDKPSIAIFNYIKNGFRYWPTCLYGRGYWLKYYEIRSGPDKCHYKKPTYLTWFNQIKMFFKNMKLNKSVPFFSFNFLTEYTHSHLAVPKEMDFELKNLIQTLDLDDTMFILFTDHGNRLKFYSYATEIGKLERYRPFLSVRLPKKFTKIENKYYKNALINQNRLVSFHDLHQTLRQFLHINKYGFDYDEQCDQKFHKNLAENRNYRGISLFEQIPINRSCKDALIPNMICSCFRKKDLTEKELIEETGHNFEMIAKLIVKNLNEIIFEEKNKCEELQFDRIISFKKMIVNNIIVYTNVLVTQPGSAWFETNLKLSSHNLKKKILNIHGLPTRLSAYGNQSNCVKNHSILVNYCYCKTKF